MTKLTLSVDEAIVDQAKQIAKKNGTSVSAMFSRFIQTMAAGRRTGIRPGPIAQEASGLIQLPPDKDYKELLTEALMEKYGFTDEDGE